MHISKLICPHCQSPYPFWRAIIRFRSHVCPGCKSKLAFTIESSERLGLTSGFVGTLILLPTILIGGFEIIRSWLFWVFLVVGSYLAGGMISALVCRFAPYEEVRASAKRWRLFGSVAARHRRVMFLELIVIPPCVVLLIFARSLPVWLLLTVSLVVIVVGILGAIASWDFYFGERGILRRWNSSEGGSRHGR